MQLQDCFIAFASAKNRLHTNNRKPEARNAIRFTCDQLCAATKVNKVVNLNKRTWKTQKLKEIHLFPIEYSNN